ncbi:hypothetical protein AB8L61_17325 [Clostridioides difficile]
MGIFDVYRTVRRRKGYYSEGDIHVATCAYEEGSPYFLTYYGSFNLSKYKSISITETKEFRIMAYEVYRYINNNKVVTDTYNMYQYTTVQVVPNPSISINNDLGVIGYACSIKYNIYDSNPDVSFKITVKLNDVVISEKNNTVDSNYTIDLTDEHLSNLVFNSVNNITIELGTVAGGKMLDKTVTFTKGNTKPKLNISSYNSTSATFIAIDTDNNLSKIEWFIDDVLKDTFTTDLTTEKTINYELTDNAIHTLKIVATDAENATAEKVLSISKEIMPLQTDSTLQDISSKLVEIGESFKNGKTSIINTLALKNIEANLNNTLVELSEKIKTSFDSSDASVEELQNRITELTNQLSQRKRWAKGTSSMLTRLIDFKKYKSSETEKMYSTEIINLAFEPTLVIVIGNDISSFNYSSNVIYKKNEYLVPAFTTGSEGRNFLLDAGQIKYSDEKIVLPILTIGSSGDKGFTWYAFE